MKKSFLFILLMVLTLTGCRNSPDTASYSFNGLSYALSDKFSESSRNEEGVLYESEKEWISIDRWEKDYYTTSGEPLTVNGVDGYYEEYAQAGGPEIDYRFEFIKGDYVFCVRADKRYDLYDLLNTLEVGQ